MNNPALRLSVQTTLPDNFDSDKSFQQALEKLEQLGFYGLELNIAHPGTEPLERIVRFLERYHLKLTSFASGLTAKTYGLSLSDKDEEVRLRSVRKLQQVIEFLSGSEVGIILGFFKGPKVEYPGIAQSQFGRSLDELLTAAENAKIPLVVEATNRYESSIANSLEDAVGLVEPRKSPYLKILPDTFHMNIEEQDMFASMKKYSKYYNNVHLSDNNRYFPGYGAMDFSKILQHLSSLGYSGGFALEGNLKAGLTEDSELAMDMIKKIWESKEH
ncbi:MAG: sugar phosphate isomerase/epimerase family protein [Spirochaetia bacterium]|nr:sugar phosphate isomerase/epimerase family protein [Spirochaetia bacterium]